MSKPLTLYTNSDKTRNEVGMHTFTGPLHVVLVMAYPENEEELLAAGHSGEDIQIPEYFQVHCPQYQQPLIFPASKKNLQSYWNWQADSATVEISEKLQGMIYGLESLQIEMQIANRHR